jgi:hypothetical protein
MPLNFWHFEVMIYLILIFSVALAIMSYLFLREALINKELRKQCAFWYNRANEEILATVNRPEVPNNILAFPPQFR